MSQIPTQEGFADYPRPDLTLPEVPSPYEGKRITAFQHLRLSAYWFGSNFLWGAFLGPVLSSQMTHLAPERSAQTLGLIYTVGTLPAILVPLIAGPISDRCTSGMGRRRPFILGGGLAAILGIALMAFGFSVLELPLYLLGYLVIQCGANTALAAYSGIIPDIVPHDQRGTASGYMAVMSQVSTLFGAILSGKMLGNHMNVQLYELMAGVFGVFVIISVLGIREVPLKGPIVKFDWAHYFRSLWIDPRKYPDFAWVWFTRALMMFGFYMIQPYILYFLRDVIKVTNPEEKAGAVIGMILLAATVSGFLGGLVSDRLGRKPVVIYSSVVIAVTCILFLFCKNLEQVLGTGIIFGLGYGAYISVDWALGTDVLPSRQDAGKDMAVWHISMTLPQQIAPLLAGQLLGLYVAGHILVDGKPVGTYGWNGYAFVFCIAAVCFFASGVLVKKVRGTT